MRELVPYSVPVIHSAVEHTSTREGVKRRAGPIAKCLPCWSWKGGYETINRLIHWANWMRARETGELRGDPRGERRAMALLFRSFIGPGSPPGGERRGSRSSKRLLEILSRGLSKDWSGWGCGVIGPILSGRDVVGETRPGRIQNHGPNQVQQLGEGEWWKWADKSVGGDFLDVWTYLREAGCIKTRCTDAIQQIMQIWRLFFSSSFFSCSQFARKQLVIGQPAPFLYQHSLSWSFMQ